MDIEELVEKLATVMEEEGMEDIPSRKKIKRYLLRDDSSIGAISENLEIMDYFKSEEGQELLGNSVKPVRDQNQQMFDDASAKLKESVRSVYGGILSDEKKKSKVSPKERSEISQIEKIIYENSPDEMKILDVAFNSEQRTASVNAIFKLRSEDLYSWVSRLNDVLPEGLKDYNIRVEKPEIAAKNLKDNIELKKVISSLGEKLSMDIEFRDAYWLKKEESSVIFYSGDEPGEDFLEEFKKLTSQADKAFFFQPFERKDEVLKKIDNNIRSKQEIIRGAEREIKAMIGAGRSMGNGDLGLHPFEDVKDPSYGTERRGTITGFGGCEQVGRSCIYGEFSGNNVIFDYGVSFTSNIEDMLPTIPSDKLKGSDFIFLSHAHLDHSGYIPSLAKKGLKNIEIVCTEPTYVLCEHLWSDFVRLRRNNGEDLLYDEEDIKSLRDQISIVEYDKEYKLNNDVKLRFLNSGHILGSSMILLEDGPERTLYTGDLSLEGTGMLEPAEIQPNITNLIIESTYGRTASIDKQKTCENLKQEISDSLEKGGSVLIPCFSIGRGQEVLRILNEMDEFRRGYTIYLDGCLPKINQVTDYYLADKGASSGFKFSASSIEGASMFMDEDMSLDEISSSQYRRMVFSADKPKVILTTSGMVEGLAKQHMGYLRKDPKNKMILVGYQARHTTGYKVYNAGSKEERARIFGHPFEMEVKYLPLSGHADLGSMAESVSKLGDLKNLFLVHGEGDNINSLYEYYRKNLASRVDKLTLGKEERLY